MVYAQMPADAGPVGMACVEKAANAHGICEVTYVLGPDIIPGIAQILCDQSGRGISPDTNDIAVEPFLFAQVLYIV